MSYEIIVQDQADEAKLLAFVQTLESAHIIERPLSADDEELVITPARKPLKDGEELPGFGSAPDWGIDADTLRKGGHSKRVAGW